MDEAAALAGAVAARLLDPLAFAACGGFAILIGRKAIAAPVGAVLYMAIGLHLGWAGGISYLSAAIAGAIMAISSLCLWRLVPEAFKRSMTRSKNE